MVTPLDILEECAGTWAGTDYLQEPETGQELQSAALANISVLVPGNLVSMEYSWSYGGEAQTGQFQVLHLQNDAPDEVALLWRDSWHMSERPMSCLGRREGADLLLHGTFSSCGDKGAGEGESGGGVEWGWTIRLQPRSAEDRLTVIMHIVPPPGEGEAALALTTEYRRAPAASIL